MALIQHKSEKQPDGSFLIFARSGEIFYLDAQDYYTYRNTDLHIRKSNACKYVVLRLDKVNNKVDLKLHRLIMRAGSGQEVHHKNGNSLDNRRSNLLLVSSTIHHILHKVR